MFSKEVVLKNFEKFFNFTKLKKTPWCLLEEICRSDKKGVLHSICGLAASSRLLFNFDRV